MLVIRVPSLDSISEDFACKTLLSEFATVSSAPPGTQRKLNISSADENSAFPAGVNAAATWSTRLLKNRGQAMGAEHAGKGVDVQLGPVAGKLDSAFFLHTPGWFKSREEYLLLIPKRFSYSQFFQ